MTGPLAELEVSVHEGLDSREVPSESRAGAGSIRRSRRLGWIEIFGCSMVEGDWAVFLFDTDKALE